MRRAIQNSRRLRECLNIVQGNRRAFYKSEIHRKRVRRSPENHTIHVPVSRMCPTIILMLYSFVFAVSIVLFGNRPFEKNIVRNSVVCKLMSLRCRYSVLYNTPRSTFESSFSKTGYTGCNRGFCELPGMWFVYSTPTVTETVKSEYRNRY